MLPTRLFADATLQGLFHEDPCGWIAFFWGMLAVYLLTRGIAIFPFTLCDARWFSWMCIPRKGEKLVDLSKEWGFVQNERGHWVYDPEEWERRHGNGS
jgi:hypothetical protein